MCSRLSHLNEIDCTFGGDFGGAFVRGERDLSQIQLYSRNTSESTQDHSRVAQENISDAGD